MSGTDTRSTHIDYLPGWKYLTVVLEDDGVLKEEYVAVLEQVIAAPSPATRTGSTAASAGQSWASPLRRPRPWPGWSRPWPPSWAPSTIPDATARTTRTELASGLASGGSCPGLAPNRHN